MLAIKNNMMAANAARYLGKSYDALAQSVERLSSGQRINSAKDDAAGMAVRELMRADIAVIDQGVRNTQDGISMLQTMEGAMATIDNALVRMKQLAEQASTGSYSSAQRLIMNNEFTEMANEVDRISKSTKFNGIAMLNKTDSGTPDPAADVLVRFGTGTNDEIGIERSDMTQDGLGITPGSAGYQATSDHGVSGSTANWLTLTETNNAGGDQTLAITFENEAAVSVTFAGTTATGVKNYTLDEVVQAINAVSLNLPVKGDQTVQAYAMASVYHNDSDGKDYLRLDSRTTTATSLAMTFDTTITTAATGGFVLAANQGATTMIESPTVPGDNGLMNVAAGTGINLLTAAAAQTAIAAVATAIGLKDTARAAFGYKINRLESTGEVLGIQSENLQTAESRISDVDVATEMAVLTRNQVLAQAGTAMLAQANSIPQMALTLLRG
jgi:flagellin